jgi:hypothetical protein
VGLFEQFKLIKKKKETKELWWFEKSQSSEPTIVECQKSHFLKSAGVNPNPLFNKI